MGRKRASEPEITAATRAVARETVHEPEIVPEGDYAGMRTEDVMRALSEQVHDTLGDVSIEVAGATLDTVLGEYLMAAQHTKGDEYAKESAIRFCQTALPYALLPIEIKLTYAQARRVRGG
jgi:hypothetical protein